jgi:predicted ArsR family transcriptional regulator
LTYCGPSIFRIMSALPASRRAVLDLIRRGERTVNTLAAQLRISDNAVRVHLIALERDGLIKRVGIVRSGLVGQPAAEYDLTPSGELALSSAYPAALAALVSATGDRLDPRARRALFLEAGRRLAETISARDSGTLQDRAESCAALIDTLGGSATVTQAKGSATVIGASCPLAAAVRNEPATCFLIEALLKKHAGVQAEQLCTHGDRPACRFRVTPS